ncbi:hypothetical protein BaRGS_00036055, partial [Batillaria attramentaria]
EREAGCAGLTQILTNSYTRATVTNPGLGRSRCRQVALSVIAPIPMSSFSARRKPETRPPFNSNHAREEDAVSVSTGSPCVSRFGHVRAAASLNALCPRLAEKVSAKYS